MTPGLDFGARLELSIPRYGCAYLSIAGQSAAPDYREKELLSSGPASIDGKATLEEHLDSLSTRHASLRTVPLVVLGLRNSLVNLRAPVIHGKRFQAVDGESPLESQRPYYGVEYRNSKLSMTVVRDEPAEWPDFFFAGIPVLWEGFTGESLLDLMLIEAADHSHIFDLPRGNSPRATDSTRQAWADLHTAFRRCVHADHDSAVEVMRGAVSKIDAPLTRSDDYLHAVLGIRADGALIYVCANGRLEDLGQAAKDHGCTRAVCVENSGSVMPTYLPKGIAGETIPLLRAPNFRPHGRAVLVLELTQSTFESHRMIP